LHSRLRLRAAGATFDVSALSGGFSIGSGHTLNGSGTVAGSVTVDSAAMLCPGTNVGTLTVTQGLTWGTGGNYNWQMMTATGTAGSTTSWDLANAGGTLTIAATQADPFKINLWTLSGSTTNGSASNFNPGQNYTWKIASATGGITGFAANKFAINTSATNGTGGFANSFAGGTFSVAQAGNQIDLVYTAGTSSVITINVATGTQTQTAAGFPLLSGTSPVVKTGAGTLVVDQANTLTGATTVQEGVLQLANGAALGSSTLAVAAGGTAEVANFLMTTVAGLDLARNGLVDVTSGFMTVTSGLSATDLVSQILAGRDGGSWTGTSGITSSTAAAEVALGASRAVGWLDNGDGSLAFAYAAPGDTNLDWQVDVRDAANVLTAGKFNTGDPATWAEGDFNYDGVVDVLDAADFITTGLYNAGIYNPSQGSIGAVAAVPEPSAWALLAGGVALSACLVARRRH
jgi:autotransporter-associated beta strand protein